MTETLSAPAAVVLAGLSGLEFAKGHGTGNDFVLIADPDGLRPLTAEQVAVLCDRHQGIGGDGLIRAIPSRLLPEGQELLASEPDAEWFMDYRNNDGSIAEMCGNGVRAFVHFLLDSGLARLDDNSLLKIGTRAGVKVVTLVPEGYAVDMGPWAFIHPEEAAERAVDSLVTARGLDGERPALSITMGNPHTVLALAGLDELAALPLTEIPAVHPTPPNGTNVEFVVPAEPLVQDGKGHVTMRVHERGVGETQSCGTGACAAAAAIRYWAGAGAPSRWDIQVPGGVVGVEFLPAAADGEHVVLSGPATIVARGRLA
ncbi:diaminopimelate epimerase [Arthrobacter woluwensis]|uniref:diaminopimelate epimerase n=1 Tax=Arthrobacter woluwensis TaxID=156980 RepID=UPI0027808AEE|nr:diaminopimelate epimerase [Arthrobacter woluwensis]MDQ0708277.1 diaminopimelate epimerase [Arthrobacter woluwensis]